MNVTWFVPGVKSSLQFLVGPKREIEDGHTVCAVALQANAAQGLRLFGFLNLIYRLKVRLVG